MKSKKDRFKSLFVSVNKRLPPDEEVPILYKTESGSFGISNGVVFNTQQRQKKKGIDSKGVESTGYFAIEWTFLY